MSISDSDLRAAIRRILQEEATKKPAAPAEDAVEHIGHCQDCFVKAVRAKFKATDYVCSNCGLPHGSEEQAKKLPACPNCGGTHSRKLDFNEKLRRMSKP